jgi:uncharacterized phage protein gp47/JayE
MALSLQQLLKPTTEEQALSFLLDTLESLGFVTTSWQDGSVQRNILTAVARQYAGATTVTRTIVEGILVRPSGLWLDLVGTFRFGIQRLAAVRTRRSVVLTSASSAPSHVIAAGSFLAVDTVRYRVIGTHALAPGNAITVSVEAEFAGIAGNAPESAEVVVQQPAYSGVTAAFAGPPVIIGVDDESDERYFRRIELRWTELTYSVGLRAYELWALTAAPSVRRVRALNNYPTENLVRVVLDPGVASEIAQVEAYIADRHPPNDLVTVQAASVVTQPITYAPRVLAGTNVDALNAELQTMLDEMPIGGVRIAGAPAGRLLRERIHSALLCRQGVQSVGLTVPAADVVLGATDVVQGQYTVTPETVVIL